MTNNKNLNSEEIISNIKKINENLKLNLDFWNFWNNIKISEIINKNIGKNINENITKKVEKHDKDINKHYNDIRKLNRNVKVLIWVWVTISSLLLFNLIYWIYESYFHTNQIQSKFETTTNNLENEIKNFQKEIDNLKENNQKLKENIKNEIEKDIYKTILETNKN